DVLLGALAVALVRWARQRTRGNDSAVLIDLEGHGREEIFAGVDLTRTVGWFTSVHPVRLDLAGVDVDETSAGDRGLARGVKLVKEQLRHIPQNGLGYGLLRYLNEETGAQLAGYAPRQLGFNYLGRFASPADADWAAAEEASALGAGADAAMPLTHAVAVNA